MLVPLEDEDDVPLVPLELELLLVSVAPPVDDAELDEVPLLPEVAPVLSVPPKPVVEALDDDVAPWLVPLAPLLLELAVVEVEEGLTVPGPHAVNTAAAMRI
ncbi:MAG: hypothetical protein JST54_10155 [Deltaproteobacteria bacterium]|nr:hypothetical protein [Deltaproteobacteria bacterium]